MKEAHSRGIFSTLHVNMDTIEQRISQIEIPTEMCRKPHGLSDLKHRKGNRHSPPHVY